MVQDFRAALQSPSSELSYRSDFANCGGPEAVAEKTRGVVRGATEEDVRAFLSGFEWIDPNQAHYCYSVYRCVLEGAVTGDTTYEFSVDVGGAGHFAKGAQTIEIAHPALRDCPDD
jgi:hypothetical protein